MWPWGHLAVGYLCYVAYTRVTERADHTIVPIFAVGFGTQLPDLVDKPLAWTFEILPSGRSLAHSLLAATVVIAFVAWIAQRRDRPGAGTAFAIGYLSHLVTDLGPETVFGLLLGDLSQLEWTTYLFWPILAAPPYSNDSSFAEHFLNFEFSAYVWVQFGLVALAAVVWVADGAPGVAETRSFVRGVISADRR